MVSTLKDSQTQARYSRVLDTLNKGSFWPREWATHQYLGLVVTAMCHAVVNDEHEARRYAVLRVLEVFLEDRHDLLPATDMDLAEPRNRIATLAIPDYEEQCEPWLDVLEYLQLNNWKRKGIYEDATRTEELRRSIREQFSSEMLEEIDLDQEDWWLR